VFLQTKIEERLLSFIHLERKFHQAKGNTDWIYELHFKNDELIFVVRGSQKVKTYVAGLLKNIGKL